MKALGETMVRLGFFIVKSYVILAVIIGVYLALIRLLKNIKKHLNSDL